MRCTISLVALLTAAGCARPQPLPRAPLGAAGHLAQAERHEVDARSLEERAAAEERTSPPQHVTCGDQALADQVHSGGERLGVQAPCWTSERSAARKREAALQLRADARAHRARARALIVTADAACRGLPDDELGQSPFDHQEDLAAVTAELAGGRLVGARIRFKAVPNLDAAWLRRALACHHAVAAATGYEPTYLATSPAVVPGARVVVEEDPAGLVVIVTADAWVDAFTIYLRAEALLDDTLRPQADLAP